MPQLDVATYSSQIFWLIICLTVVFISLKYIFIPKIESSIRNRQRRIERMIVDAEKMQLEAEALNKKYSESIKQAHLEATEIQKKAIGIFDSECESRIVNLSHEQREKNKIVIKELEELKQKFMEEIDQKSQFLLEEFLSKILSTNTTPPLKKSKQND